MVRIADWILLGACTLFSTSSALPQPAVSPLDILERDVTRTVTNTFTGPGGHQTRTYTHTFTRAHTPKTRKTYTHTHTPSPHTHTTRTRSTYTHTHTPSPHTHTPKTRSTRTPTTKPTKPTTPTTPPTTTPTTPTTPPTTTPTTPTTPPTTTPNSPTTTTTTKKPQPTYHGTPGTCAYDASAGGEYTDSKGVTYEIDCGALIVGAPFSTVSTSSFGGCLNLCSANPNCVAFHWDYPVLLLPGQCFLFDISVSVVPSLISDAAVVISR